MAMIFDARPIVPGHGAGRALTTTTPLSFWGGMDAESGEIIDRSHPLSGERVTGKVLVLPHGRGSCSGSGVILEAIRNNTAPAAIITTRVDPIIALGSILGDEMYGRPIPILVVAEDVFAAIADGDALEVQADGGLVRHDLPG
jgi:predicted aconitase with swiveling domain